MPKFIVYEKAGEANKEVTVFLEAKKVDQFKYQQLKRASNSVFLNIAEGNGRFTPADRKNFFVIARGAAQEVLAVFDLLVDEGVINEGQSKSNTELFVEVIKILTSIIGRLDKQVQTQKW